MTNEIPEMPEEMLTISKDSLKKISFLVEKLNLDLNGDDKARKAAAAVMIHIIMSILSKKQTMDSFIKGEFTELSDFVEDQIPTSNDHRSQQ